MASTTNAAKMQQKEDDDITEHLALTCISKRYTKKATLTWAIKDFFERLDTAERCQRTDEEDRLESDEFSIPIRMAKGECRKLKFRLRVAFNSSGENASHIGVYITSLPTDTSFTMTYKISLKIGTVTGNLGLSNELKYSSIFKSKGSLWGWDKSFLKRDLRANSSKLLQNGELSFTAKLEIECQHSQNPTEKIPKEPVHGYLGKRLWDSRSKTADVILICQDVNIPAHKNVLVCSSDVLEAMFNYGDMVESQTGTIHIKDVSPDCLEEFLHYLYFNSMSRGDNKSLESIEELLMVSEKYNVADLKTRCELKLTTMVNDSNVGRIGVIANMHNTCYLRDYVVHYVVHNYQDLVKEHGDQWRTLPNDIIKDALALLAQ